MKKIFYIFIFLTSMLYSQTITVATGEWSPWVSTKLKNYGIAADITTEAFKTQGINTKFYFYPWKRTYKVAKVAQNDTAGYYLKTADREKDFYFSDPVFNIKNKLIYKKGKNITFNSLEDLKNYSIGITRGYSYSEEIDAMIKNKEINTFIVNNDLAGLKQTLKKNSFDAFLCSQNVAKSLIAENFSKKDQELFQFSKKDVFKKPVFLMVSKQHKNSKAILNSFNKGLKTLHETKVIEKLLNESTK